MRYRRPLLFVGLLALLSVCALVWHSLRERHTDSHVRGATRVEVLPARLQKLQQRLAAVPPATDAGAILVEIAKALHTVPHSEAVVALLALLDSGIDAP